MKFTDLNPKWVNAGGEGYSDKDGNPIPHRAGVGVTFDCPDGCGHDCYIPFENPVGGGGTVSKYATWKRTGTELETLTIHPSINRPKKLNGCGWHGWVKNGVVTSC